MAEFAILGSCGHRTFCDRQLIVINSTILYLPYNQQLAE